MKLDFLKSDGGEIKDKASDFFNNLKNKVEDEQKLDLNSISFEINHDVENDYLESKNIVETVGIKKDDTEIVTTVNTQNNKEEIIADSAVKQTNTADELKAKLDAIFSKNIDTPSSVEVSSVVNKIHETKNFKKLDRDTIAQPETTKEELTTSITEKLQENPNNQALQELAELFGS